MPPRVGSRSTCTASPAASRSARTRGHSAAVSLSTSASNSSPSRAAMIAMPWQPIGPLTRMRSPSRARPGAGAKSSRSTPTPVVLMNMPSALPRSTTLVSPVTIGTPAAAAASPMARITRCSVSIGSPSSRMKPAVRYAGSAPIIATSFSVPCTARWPMLPPGNSSGLTTKLSVDMAMRPPAMGSTAPSPSCARCSLPITGRK